MKLEAVGLVPTYVRMELLNASHESSVLMLSHAFDTLDLNRVKLIADYLNTSSRRAVLKLSAKEPEVMSNHVVMADRRV